MKRRIRQLKEVADSQSGMKSLVVDPRVSHRLWMWDMTTALALVFTCMVTPFEVSFLVEATTPLFVINRLIDVVFLLDIALQFCLAFPTKADFAGAGSLWVTDHPTIIRHYLSGWFGLDLVATLVAIFDILSFSTGDAALQRMQILRTLRVLRLAKLLRLLRGMRIFRRIELRVGFDYSRLALVQSMTNVLIVAHWSACLWSLQVSFESQLENTWMVETGYCRLDAEVTVETPGGALFDTPPPVEGAAGTYRCVSPGDMYAAALYFSTMTLTTVGYGDISATPQNASEQWIATILMVASGVAWSHFAGTFVAFISSMDPATTAFRLSMRALNSFSEANALPAELRYRLRDFFFRTRHLEKSLATSDCLRKLSPSLQGEVLFRVNAAWLSKVHSANTRRRVRACACVRRRVRVSSCARVAVCVCGCGSVRRVIGMLSPTPAGSVSASHHAPLVAARSQVPWLANEDPFFISTIVMAFHPEVFVPGEVCAMPDGLHVVHSGSAIYGGGILGKGDVWGTDVILAARHLRSSIFARAITYLEAYYITRDTIFACAARFGDTADRLRRAARVLALQRYVVLVSKVSRNAQSFQKQQQKQQLCRAASCAKLSWHRAVSKERVATDMEKQMGGSDSKSFAKRDAELTFEERYLRSRQHDLTRALFVMADDKRGNAGEAANGDGGGGALTVAGGRTLRVRQRPNPLASDMAAMRKELTESLAAMRQEQRQLLESLLQKDRASLAVRRHRKNRLAAPPPPPPDPNPGASSEDRMDA